MPPKIPFELRARQRITPQGPRSIFLRLPEHPNLYPVSDISYDGIGINNADFETIDKGAAIQGSILFLENKVDVSLCFAQLNGTIAGFKINYKDPDNLMRMREIIEPLQTGASLKQIGPSNPSKGIIKLMGSLGASFISTDAESSFLTLHCDLKEYSFEWADGTFSQLLSKKQIEVDGFSQRSKRPKIPEPLLRNAYLFLLGIEWPSENDRVRNEICAAIEKLLHTRPTLLKVVTTKTDS